VTFIAIPQGISGVLMILAGVRLGIDPENILLTVSLLALGVYNILNCIHHEPPRTS
jgi:hypothetical protein